MHKEESFDVLIGKTIHKITNANGECPKKWDDVVFLYTIEGPVYKMYHEQDCCEYVRLEDICGDLNDLIGCPIRFAEKVTNSKDKLIGCDYNESFTWTFYKISTISGDVTIRWYGVSNGYYSESVNFTMCDFKISREITLPGIT